MKVLFQNHSSLLIQVDDRYLLTDPWYNQPAFGSWLPSFAPYIHPSYLAALGEKLTILISHAHDDHFDDRLLTIFDKNTSIVTADFKSPSVLNRVKSLGFNDVITVSEEEKVVGDFIISSYIVEEFSHDDAAYLIRTEKGAVIHSNDNWREFESHHEELISERISQYSKDAVLLFSQTNSASGFPLNYRNFDDVDKQKLLRSKVASMVQAGLRKSERLGLDRMFSYAGFASAYVKDKSYHEDIFFPTASFLKKLVEEESIKSKVEISDLYPGDFISLPDSHVHKAFVSGYKDQNIKSVTDSFYRTYGNIKECISFRDLEVTDNRLSEWTEEFLTEFNNFVQYRVEGPDSHFTELLGKTFSIEIDLDSKQKIQKSIKFGSGLVKYQVTPNKACYVDGPAFYAILKGEALFEDLYTGYNAEWMRNPSDVYNRDMVMMIIIFSYVSAMCIFT